MRIYVRKIDAQAINKQISILTEIATDFFGKKESIVMVGRNSSFVGNVSLLPATDYRLGGDIKKIIKAEGDMNVGDLLVIYKSRNNFTLEILKENSERHSALLDMFINKDRHMELLLEKKEDEQIESLGGYNKIYYGIPGCGKSYKVSAMLNHEEGFVDEAIANKILKPADSENIFRTTFYLDYSNSDFIGQIYPKVIDGNVIYEPVPGPFTQALVRAYDNPKEMIYLIIEEINRGNAAAIFGDTFQLIDRLKTNKNGRVIGDSEYPIFNNFIDGYITKQNEKRRNESLKEIPYEKGCVYIPHNLTIIATMNTSDQNVFPLDTAFKRRWEKERVIGDWEKDPFKNAYIPYTNVSWFEFGDKINKRILSKTDDGIMTEDKQIGPYFASLDMFTEQPNIADKNKLDRFVNNVLDYLFTDVSKFDHSTIFNANFKTFDDLYNEILNIKNKEELSNDIKDSIFKNLFNKDVGFQVKLKADDQNE